MGWWGKVPHATPRSWDFILRGLRATGHKGVKQESCHGQVYALDKPAWLKCWHDPCERQDHGSRGVTSSCVVARDGEAGGLSWWHWRPRGTASGDVLQGECIEATGLRWESVRGVVGRRLYLVDTPRKMKDSLRVTLPGAHSVLTRAQRLAHVGDRRGV